MGWAFITLLRKRAFHVSVACVVAATAIALFIHHEMSKRAVYELRLHIIPDHGLSQAYLSKFPVHVRAYIIEKKRDKLMQTYHAQFQTNLHELQSQTVLRAAIDRLPPAVSTVLRNPAHGAPEPRDLAQFVEVARDGKSELLLIRGLHPDLAVSTAIVNAVAGSYGDYRRALRAGQREYALAYLKDTCERLDAEYKGLLFSVDGSGAGATGKIDEEMLKARLAKVIDLHDRAMMERIDAEAAAQALEGYTEIEDAALCAREYAALQDVRETYRERHPRYAQARGAVESCRSKADDKRTAERRAREEHARVARLKEHGFKAAALALSASLEQIGLDKAGLKPRALEAAQVKANADTALKRYLDAFYDDRSFQPDFREVDRSTPARSNPYAIWLTLLASVLAGAGTAGGVWSARRVIRGSVSGAGEIERLGVRVAAEIPAAGHGIRKVKRLLGMVDLYAHDRPESDTAERFKHLRTYLAKHLPDGAPATLCVTSSIPGEGKTFCAINTAIAFAAAGVRTLLIDADLRKARLTGVLDADGRTGLSNILYEMRRPDGLCRPTRVPSLSVLPAGTVDEIFAIDPDRLVALLAELKSGFDRIVIDLPPLTATADPLLVASVADGTVLVVKKDHVPEDVLRHTLARLAKPSHKFIGVVLNWSGFVSGYFAD